MGLERRTMRKVVPVPAGVDNEMQIRLAGEGQPGINGGPHGNLYIKIRVKPHKFFRRRDRDILLDLSVNVAQATLGAEVEIPTVDGPTKLKIPSGTQPGKVLTIKGKGVPNLRSTGRGDQLVIINIDVPTHLTAEQRKLFESLAQTLGSQVLPQEKGFMDILKDMFSG
jgi:molecular chaperone DnaJ